ncbi:hypothetical protein [Pseudomonas plecoglossicida]
MELMQIGPWGSGQSLHWPQAAAFHFAFNAKARSARWINPFKMG